MEVSGDIHKQKSTCLEDIQRWDSVEEGSELDEEQGTFRKVAKVEYDKILAMEEVMWQKSTVL